MDNHSKMGSEPAWHDHLTTYRIDAEPDIAEWLVETQVLILDTRLQDIAGHLEMAWVIIANANGGDWDSASDEWREAAVKWRDEYHALTQEDNDEVDS
jgi:hypothetical protein